MISLVRNIGVFFSMLNTMNRGNAYRETLGKRALSFFPASFPYLPYLIGVKFAAHEVRLSFPMSGSFLDMFEALLATAHRFGGCVGSGPRHLSLASLGQLLDVLWALLAAKKCGPCLRRTFGRLFSSSLAYRHFAPSVFVGVPPGCSLATVGHVGEICARISIVSNPPSFGFLPIAGTKFNRFYHWHQPNCKKLLDPARTVGLETLSPSYVGAHPFFDIVRPPDVTNSAIARVFEHVDVPKFLIFHDNIIPQNLCGYKRERALCGYAGEHDELDDAGWERFEWKANGGYGNQGKKTSRGRDNATREVIWFNKSCVKPDAVQGSLF